MSFSTPITYEDGKAVSAAQINRDLYNNLAWLAAVYPRRVTLYHDESTVIAGNPITHVIDTRQLFMTAFYQNAAALNDQWRQTVRLGAGLYQVRFIGMKTSASGQFSIDIGGASVGDGFDAYAASIARNVDLCGGAGYFEAIRPGLYDLTVTVYGKHASSSGYDLRLSAIQLLTQELEA